MCAGRLAWIGRSARPSPLVGSPSPTAPHDRSWSVRKDDSTVPDSSVDAARLGPRTEAHLAPVGSISEYRADRGGGAPHKSLYLLGRRPKTKTLVTGLKAVRASDMPSKPVWGESSQAGSIPSASAKRKPHAPGPLARSRLTLPGPRPELLPSSGGSSCCNRCGAPRIHRAEGDDRDGNLGAGREQGPPR